jgi:hypothetical protein
VRVTHKSAGATWSCLSFLRLAAQLHRTPLRGVERKVFGFRPRASTLRSAMVVDDLGDPVPNSLRNSLLSIAGERPAAIFGTRLHAKVKVNEVDAEA